MVALLVALVLAVALVVAIEVVPVVRARRGRVLFPLPQGPAGRTWDALAPRPPEASVHEGGPIADLFADEPVLPPEAVAEPAPAPELEATGAAGADAAVEAGASRRHAEPNGSARRIEPDGAEGPDAVLHALIERVRASAVDPSSREVARVVGALVDHGIGGEEMEKALIDLVERPRPAAGDAELRLFGEQVPARPGRLTDFAELTEAQRRRVIIRVLCLLVAQDDESPAETPTDGADAEVIDLREPDRRRRWGDVVEQGKKRRLPLRRRLVRSRV